MWHMRVLLPVWKRLTVDGTGVRRYNSLVVANSGSGCLAGVVLTIVLAGLVRASGGGPTPATTGERKEGAASEHQPTATDVLDMMLDSQANLRGYRADALVEVTTQRARLPKITVRLEVRRPAEVTIGYLWAKVKPRYPLFPDPAMFCGGQYSVAMNRTDDERHYWLTARPTAGAASPYAVDLWVDRLSGLLSKARLTHPSGESTTLTADYTRMGPKCWVPQRVRGEGAMLISDMLPLAPVSLALRLSGRPETVTFSAVFSNISLLK